MEGRQECLEPGLDFRRTSDLKAEGKSPPSGLFDPMPQKETPRASPSAVPEQLQAAGSPFPGLRSGAAELRQGSGGTHVSEASG